MDNFKKSLYQKVQSGEIKKSELTQKGIEALAEYESELKSGSSGSYNSVGAFPSFKGDYDSSYDSSIKSGINEIHPNDDGFDIVVSGEPKKIQKDKGVFDKIKGGLAKVPSLLSNFKQEAPYSKTHLWDGNENISIDNIELPKLHQPIPQAKTNLNTGGNFDISNINLADNLRKLQRPIPEAKTNFNPSIDFDFERPNIPQMKTQLNQDESKNLDLDKRFGHAWLQNNYYSELTKQAYGFDNRADELKAQLDEYERLNPSVITRPTGNSPGELFNRGMVGVAEQVPLMAQSGVEYVKKGLPAGLGALALGQLGPQVGLPEEIVTVPTAFNTVGNIAATKKMFDIEFGNVYADLLEEGVDKETARKYATVVGLANAGLEKFGMDKLVKTIPGAKEAIKTIGSKGFKEVGEKFLKGSGKNTIKEFGKYMVSETGQEVLQEGVSMTGEHFAKKEQFGDEYKYDSKAGNKRLIDTAVESALTFGIMGIPGHSMQYANNRRAELDKLDKAVEEVKTEVSNDPKIKKGSEFNEKIKVLKGAINKNLELPGLTNDEVEQMALIRSKVDELMLDTDVEAGPVGAKEIKEEVVEKVNNDKPIPITQNTEVKGTNTLPNQEKALEGQQTQGKEEVKDEAMADQEQPIAAQNDENEKLNYDDLKPGHQVELETYGKVAIQEIDESVVKVKNENGAELSIGKEAFMKKFKGKYTWEKPILKKVEWGIKSEDLKRKEPLKPFTETKAAAATDQSEKPQAPKVDVDNLKPGDKLELKNFGKVTVKETDGSIVKFENEYGNIVPIGKGKVKELIKSEVAAAETNQSDSEIEENKAMDQENLTIDKRIEIEKSFDTKKDDELIHPNSSVTHETLKDNRFNSAISKMLKDKVKDIPVQDLSLLNQEFTHRLISTGKAIEDVMNEVVNEYKKNGSSMFKDLVEAKQNIIQEQHKAMEKPVKPLFKDGELEFGIKENMVDEASKRTSKETGETIEGTKRGSKYSLDISKYIAADKEQTIKNLEDLSMEIKEKADELEDKLNNTELGKTDQAMKYEELETIYDLMYMELTGLKRDLKNGKDINTTITIDRTDDTSNTITDEELRLEREERFIEQQAQIHINQLSVDEADQRIEEEKKGNDRKTYIKKYEKERRFHTSIISRIKKHGVRLNSIIPEGMSQKEYKKSIWPRIKEEMIKQGMTKEQYQGLSKEYSKDIEVGNILISKKTGKKGEVIEIKKDHLKLKSLNGDKTYNIALKNILDKYTVTTEKKIDVSNKIDDMVEKLEKEGKGDLAEFLKETKELVGKKQIDQEKYTEPKRYIDTLTDGTKFDIQKDVNKEIEKRTGEKYFSLDDLKAGDKYKFVDKKVEYTISTNHSGEIYDKTYLETTTGLVKTGDFSKWVYQNRLQKVEPGKDISMKKFNEDFENTYIEAKKYILIKRVKENLIKDRATKKLLEEGKFNKEIKVEIGMALGQLVNSRNDKENIANGTHEALRKAYKKILESETLMNEIKEHVFKELGGESQNVEKERLLGNADEKKSYTVYRRDKKEASMSGMKPHGLYMSLVNDKETFKSPHEDVGDTDYWGNAKPKNPLIADMVRVEHKRFGSMKSGDASSGVAALKKLVSDDEFNRLLKLTKGELVKELNEKFPGADYNRYYDSYELLEVYSAQLARQQGYDSIILEDKTMPNFSEFVALNDNVLELENKPKTDRTPLKDNQENKAMDQETKKTEEVKQEPKQIKQLTFTVDNKKKTVRVGDDVTFTTGKFTHSGKKKGKHKRVDGKLIEITPQKELVVETITEGIDDVTGEYFENIDTVVVKTNEIYDFRSSDFNRKMNEKEEQFKKEEAEREANEEIDNSIDFKPGDVYYYKAIGDHLVKITENNPKSRHVKAVDLLTNEEKEIKKNHLVNAPSLKKIGNEEVEKMIQDHNEKLEEEKKDKDIHKYNTGELYETKDTMDIDFEEGKTSKFIVLDKNENKVTVLRDDLIIEYPRKDFDDMYKEKDSNARLVKELTDNEINEHLKKVKEIMTNENGKLETKPYKYTEFKRGNPNTETKEVSPAQEIADHVIGKLDNNEKFNSSELFKVAEEKLGKMSEGRLTPKDAYDYMELGVNQYLLNQNEMDLTTRDTEVVKENVKKLDDKLQLLPTQTKRTQEQEKYQQFSTPPTIAYIANWLADVKNTDTILEPSAGIGGLAVFSKINKAKVIVNELSDRRFEILKNMNFDKMFKENAEQIDNILPGDVKPSVVIMNPPFTSTIRMSQKTNEVAKKHLTQALERLEPGGRLVCITGRGMSQETPSFKKFWKDMKKEYNVRANVSIEGKNYKKYGTNFDIQLIVIDKTGATTNETITNKISDINQIIDLLEGVANDRNHKEVKQSISKSSSQEATKEGGNSSSGGSTIHSTTDVMGNGSDRDTRSGQESGASNRGNEVDTRRDDPSTKTKGDNEVSNTKSTDQSDSNEKPRADRDGDISNRSDTSSLSNDRGIEVQKKKTKKKTKELTNAVYDNYEPQKLKIKGAKSHPGQLAQSSAMAAVEPPNPTYKPKLPKEVVNEGKLSIAQLEAVVYAGQCHEQTLPNGARKGFFIGDGTGVGKGREIGGIILDNMKQGRKKAVWVSKNDLLFDNAKDDFGDVGGDKSKFLNMSKYKNGQTVKEKDGVMFITYPTLANGQTVDGSGNLKQKEGVKTRLDQLVDWLGKDFDGVIAFDEAHNMQSAISVKGKRGNKKPSARAISGIELQKRLPNARIVYVSATGATEVHNLAYAERLGLWGEGTPFANKDDFINKISEGGLASMELVARDMKAMGVYMARGLSYDGVEYDTLTHKLTPDQTEIYDTMARGWQTVLQNLSEALKETMQEKSNKRGQVYGQFWGSQQRFYNQVLTSMQMPSVIKSMKEDLINGYSPVLQLVNTNEAIMNRKVAKAQEEERSLDDIDLTPRDILMQYLENSFPTQQYEEYEDEDGNKRLRPVVDSEGNPVINKKAEKMKEDLLTELGAMKVPEGPLEMVLNTFGADNVAEVTGRSRRVVKIDGETKLESRTKRHTKADVDSFMNDEKQILVFSDAGGTGKSYHTSLAAKNQRRRMHYLIQAGWRADGAVQGFGRTHRTNQANAPKFILVTTDLKGHKRFISSIARRLDQLGALTKGERKTGSQGLFSAKDNLESGLAKDSLQNFYKALASDRLPGLSVSVFEKLGLNDLISDGVLTSDPDKLRDIPKFLNRLLALEGELQNEVFNAFSKILDHATKEAEENGTLDIGLENYTADKIKISDEKVVRTDESGAETKYVALEVQNKNQKLTFRECSNPDNFFYKTLGFYKNEKSGNIRLVTEGHNRTLESGRIVSNVKLYDQKNDTTIIEKNKFENSKWVKIEKEEAKELWNKALKQVPEYKTETKHFISGALLPIWDRLPKGHVRVMRVLTDDGDMFLGRLIPESRIDSTLRSLGAEREKGEINLKDTVEKIIDKKYEAHFANKWKVVRRKVSGDYRLELIGSDVYKYMGELKKAGVFTERIQYETRFFIPTGDKSVEVLEKITKHRPIIDVIAPNEDIADKINRKKSSGKVGIVHDPKAFNGPVNPKPMEKFNCGNEEAQKAFDSSNGVKLKIGFTTKMQNFATKFWELSTRQFQHLPNIAEFSEASNILRELGCKKAVSIYEALKNLHGITLDQDPTRYYNFRWKVVLDNEKENYEKGLQLRFITDPAEFEKAYEKITKIVNNDPILKEALQTRKDIMKNVTDTYIAAMQKIGVDFSDKFDRESYFRQQIMEYAELKQMVKGTGKKLKTPIGSYTIGRKDTDKAYNTQYLEAEYEVMSQMIYDTMIARALSKIIGKYDISTKLQNEVKKENNKVIKPMVKEFKKEIEKLLAEDKIDPKQAEYQNKNARKIVKKRLEEAGKLITVDKLLKEKYPEYKKMQLKEGNFFYKSRPITGQMVDEMLQDSGIEIDKHIDDPKLKGAIKDILAELNKQKPILAIGGKNKEYIMKNELVDTLENFKKPMDLGPVLTPTTNVTRYLMRKWKPWQLIQPRRFFKYNYRNMISDLEMCIYNPDSFKYSKRAASEIIDVFFKGKMITGDLYDFYTRGGFDSLLSVQELNEVQHLKIFDNLYEQSESLKNAPKNIGGLIKTALWDKPMQITQAREAVLRYANYLSFLDQLEKGKLKSHGASNMKLINGLADNKDKAFNMADDLMGAYDKISVMGQEIRANVIPFWSYQEMNFKRYIQLFKNATSEDKHQNTIGKYGIVAFNIAKFYVAANIVRILTQTINYALHGDDEDKLPEYVQRIPHVIVGHDKHGDPIVISRLGNTQDFNDWFGLNGIFTHDMKDFLNGRKTIGEIVKDMGKSPLNKLIGGITPMAKTPVELIAGRSAFPNAFEPRFIRDKWEHLAQSVGLENEYKAVFNKPDKGYAASLSKLFYDTYNEDQGACFKFIDVKNKWLLDHGITPNEPNPSREPKTLAMYYLKQSVRYKDKEAFEKYLGEYIKYGGTLKGYEKSIELLDPLAGVRKEFQDDFVNDLNYEEMELYEAARAYYDDYLAKSSETGIENNFSSLERFKSLYTKSHAAYKKRKSKQPLNQEETKLARDFKKIDHLNRRINDNLNKIEKYKEKGDMDRVARYEENIKKSISKIIQ